DPDDEGTIPALLDALGPAARFVGATLRGSATPTQLDAGYKANVVPTTATGVVDARFLPESHDASMAVLRELAGEHVRIEPIHEDIGMEVPFAGDLVDTMVASVLAEDPDATVLPYLLSAGTDNKSLA